MKIIDQSLLAQFRLTSRCELCGHELRYLPEVHHVFSRGAGRLDIRINLIALGGPWDCGCHRKFHDGKASRADILAVVAAREGFTAESIELSIYALRRADKTADAEKILTETLDNAQ